MCQHSSRETIARAIAINILCCELIARPLPINTKTRVCGRKPMAEAKKNKDAGRAVAPAVRFVSMLVPTGASRIVIIFRNG